MQGHQGQSAPRRGGDSVGPPRTFFGETSGRGLNHPFAIMLYWLQSTNMGISRTAAQRAFFSVDKDLRRFAGSGHWAAWAGGRRPLLSFPHDSVRVMFTSCSKVRQRGEEVGVDAGIEQSWRRGMRPVWLRWCMRNAELAPQAFEIFQFAPGNGTPRERAGSRDPGPQAAACLTRRARAPAAANRHDASFSPALR